MPDASVTGYPITPGWFLPSLVPVLLTEGSRVVPAVTSSQGPSHCDRLTLGFLLVPISTETKMKGAERSLAPSSVPRQNSP